MMMTTNIVDIKPTEALLKNMEKFPYLEKYLEENNGDIPACFFEEELYSHDEFRDHLKKIVYERLGIILDLSSTE